jgi:hypothetical protein
MIKAYLTGVTIPISVITLFMASLEAANTRSDLGLIVSVVCIIAIPIVTYFLTKSFLFQINKEK